MSDPDLIRDLEAFKALHQPKPEEPQKPASEETAVKMHAVQLAMQELSRLERERAQILLAKPAQAEALRKRLEQLVSAYKRLGNPELIKQTRTCPKQKFYTHTLFQFRWFDELNSRMLVTSQAEHCHFGYCDTNRDAADQELYTARLEVWEAMQRISDQIRSTNEVDTSQQTALTELENRIQIYRSIVEQSLAIQLPPHIHQDTTHSQVETNITNYNTKPTLAHSEPRSQHEAIIERDKIVQAILQRRFAEVLCPPDRYGVRKLPWSKDDNWLIHDLLSKEHQRDSEIIYALAVTLDRLDLLGRGQLFRTIINKDFILNVFNRKPSPPCVLLCHTPQQSKLELWSDPEVMLAAITGDKDSSWFIAYPNNPLNYDKAFARKVLCQFPQDAKFHALFFNIGLFKDSSLLKLSGYSSIEELYSTSRRWKEGRPSTKMDII